MKPIIFTVLMVLATTTLSAGHEQAVDLVAALESAVSTAAGGNIAAAVHSINAESSKPKDLKDINAQIGELKAAYQKLDGLGKLDGTERLSLVYTGESFFRLRVVEKREEGAVLWTFVGCKLRGTWYCKGMNFAANGDLLELMKNLDAADAKPGAEGAH
jgi:hypothetical protein